jgi:tyrosinase
VNSIRGFGYTYEGLEYWRKTKTQLTADATALINRKYGPAQMKFMHAADTQAQLRTHYFVTAQVKLEELERPCSLNFYTNGTSVGTLSLLMQPPRGVFHGKFALPDTAKPADKSSTLDEVLESLRIEIIKAGLPSLVENSQIWLTALNL